MRTSVAASLPSSVDYVAMESCFLATTQETHPAIYAALLEEQRCTSAVGFLSPAHTQLFTLSQRIIDAGGRAQKKQENLRQLLATDFKDNFAHEPLLPVRFDLPLSHVLASTAKVFQSAMTPFALEFVVAGSSREAPRHEAKSTVSEGEGVDICKQCGHSYAKCLCLRCAICNALLVQAGVAGARERRSITAARVNTPSAPSAAWSNRACGSARTPTAATSCASRSCA